MSGIAVKAGRKLRVLCSFDAQACNPKALMELAVLGASIRSHPRLHAKLYISDAVVVVGSPWTAEQARKRAVELLAQVRPVIDHVADRDAAIAAAIAGLRPVACLRPTVG